jgi:hypothetical protein
LMGCGDPSPTVLHVKLEAPTMSEATAWDGLTRFQQRALIKLFGGGSLRNDGPAITNEVEGDELMTADGKPIGKAETPAIAEDVAERLNEDDSAKSRTDGRLDPLAAAHLAGLGPDPGARAGALHQTYPAYRSVPNKNSTSSRADEVAV